MPSYRHQREGKLLQYRNSPLGFTLLNVDPGQAHSRLLAANPWRCIEVQLLQEKDRYEAVAFIHQARDFYSAAEAAKTTARPVALYYSAMNLAKTLILYKNPKLDLSNSQHGLSEERSNRAARRTSPGNQRVSVKGASSSRPQIMQEFSKAIGWGGLRNTDFMVLELMKRIPWIHRSYCHVLNVPERQYLVTEAKYRFDHSTREVWTVIGLKKSHFESPGALGSLTAKHHFSDLFARVESDESGAGYYVFESKAFKYSTTAREAIKDVSAACLQAGLVPILTWQGYRYYVANHGAKNMIHPILAGYMLMFYFGSVARYTPRSFEGLLRSKYGWLIEEFLQSYIFQLVYYVASMVTDREVLAPYVLRSASGPV